MRGQSRADNASTDICSDGWEKYLFASIAAIHAYIVRSHAQSMNVTMVGN